VRRQSDHFDDYRAALARLESLGVLYPCFCSRKDIAAAASAPHAGDVAIYPGTCRDLHPDLAAERKAVGDPFALRLDVAKAMARTGRLTFWDADGDGWQQIVAEPERLGDVVLGRRDAPASYHLCAGLDDHLQGITLVIRGEDLCVRRPIFTGFCRRFWACKPCYNHHVLLVNESGERLSNTGRRGHAAQSESQRDERGRGTGNGRISGCDSMMHRVPARLSFRALRED